MSEELKVLLVQVITSWQVIAVTVALILYIGMVRYVTQYDPMARVHNIPRPKPPKPKKEKKPPAPAAADDDGLEDAESA
ncbi:MAG: hypothetical protein LBD13_07005 [Spirochaetaceae bacterium]|jgi:hypothetical protein|nr:hypothetical protein [Spirochaetaceae bacterium]